jgi:hypothetical protein
VECEVLERTSGLPFALSITVLAPPEATPRPVEFQETIGAIEPPWWNIGPFRVKQVGDTAIDPDLTVGELVFVKALEQASGELWATSIHRVPASEVQIDGTIDAYSSSSISIGGTAMTITPATQFHGTPVVGRLAQARALHFPDGSLTALVVVVFEPEPPTPTLTPTTEPTATSTDIPPASPTSTTEPTSTAASEPTATPTP